jgi:molecular chaperone DnaJ
MEKNYYDILGITEDEKKLPQEEFSNILKQRYRKLAQKYHPDMHVNDSDAQKKEAEERFKEINEANAILSDPEKRKQYDNGGADFSEFLKKFHHWGFGGSPFGDFFRDSDFGFDSDGGSRGMAVVKGDDVNVRVNITLDKAYQGGDVKVTYIKSVVCDHCHGTGSNDGKTHECPHCHGSGMQRVETRRGNMLMQQMYPCRYCGGTGRVISSPCSKCGGTGLKKITVTETVQIPAGINSGMAFKVQGLGCEAPNVGGKSINGDLIVIVSVDNDNYFTRVDNINVVHYDEIPFNKAMLGFKKTYKTIDGGEVEVNAPECTKDGKAFYFKGRGMPNINGGRGERGDYAVVIKYKYPSALTNKQKKVLEEW